MQSENKTVEVTTTTENGTANSPIKAYYEFPSSNVEQKVTYENRMGTLSEKLGNKDSVKG